MAVKLKLSVSVLALGIALASGSALAYQQGDMIVRGGVAVVDPDASGDPLEVDIDDNAQLGLTFTYMLADDVAVEVLAATPFSHTVSLEDGTDIADVKHLPPTVSIQYFPMASDSAFQPYLGLGLNYTTFFDEEAKPVLGDASVKLDDSFGLAIQLGCDYDLGNSLVLNAAIWKIDIDTTASINGTDVTDVEIDPLVYMVGLGYKF